jgi:phage tail-like protein
MALTADQRPVEYQVPSYRFVVSVGDDRISFRHAWGLGVTVGEPPHTDGAGRLFSLRGPRGAVNVTLSKGAFKGRSALYDWVHAMAMNRVGRRDLVVGLANDASSRFLVTWNVANAYPTSMTSTTLGRGVEEFAIQVLTLTADRVTVHTY